MTPEPTWPRWMTAETVARYIDRTERGVRGLVSRGAIPFHRINGRLVFGRDEIDAWITHNGKEPR